MKTVTRYFCPALVHQTVILAAAWSLIGIVVSQSSYSQMVDASRSVIVKARVKPDKPWKEYPTRTISTLPDFPFAATDQNLDIYGGKIGQGTEATGFFYTKIIGDRWWLIDPLGNRCYNRSVVSVTVGTSPNASKALMTRFGKKNIWADSTARLLKEYGFNGTGAWSDVAAIKESNPRLVYTVLCSFMSSYGKRRGGTYMQPGHTGYPNDCIFAFDPGFESFCDWYAQKLSENKNDPFLLGYFSDNEMPFPEDALDRYLRLKTSDPGYQATEKWLKERRGSVLDTVSITDEERSAFLEFVAERYFGTVARAIKKYDPNHLFIGARFYGYTLKLKPLFVAAGRFLDVVSINYYDKWTPDLNQMQQWVDWTGKPILITEWYVKGADAGLPNKTGAGWIVPTQNDRGLFYQNYTLALLQFKGCVGWHWFKYMDNDPEDKKVDPSNNDSNKGIVNIRFEPYLPLMERMKELNQRVYRMIDYFDGPVANK